MLLGLVSKIRLSAMDELDGWLKTTLLPALMLNDDQFSVAVLDVCDTDRRFPDCTAVALPELTKPLTLVPQLPARHGTGN
jgi:hypothetical protein